MVAEEAAEACVVRSTWVLEVARVRIRAYVQQVLELVVRIVVRGPRSHLMGLHLH